MKQKGVAGAQFAAIPPSFFCVNSILYVRDDRGQAHRVECYHVRNGAGRANRVESYYDIEEADASKFLIEWGLV